MVQKELIRQNDNDTGRNNNTNEDDTGINRNNRSLLYVLLRGTNFHSALLHYEIATGKFLIDFCIW